MDSRERVKLTLNHQQPDKTPVDLGSTNVTGIAAGALDKLRKALKLEARKVKVHHPFMMLGYVEEDLLEAIGGDFMGIRGPYSSFGYRNENWKPWNLMDGTEVLIGEGFNAREAANGDLLFYPGGAKPSARLPKGGYYFDPIVRQEPIDEDNLDGRRDYADQFKIYNDTELRFIENEATSLFNNTQYALVSNFGMAGIGDLGRIPGMNLAKTPGIRSNDEWLMAHLLYPNYIKEVFDYQIEISMENLKLYKQALGDKIEVIVVSCTDFGTQKGEFISPDLFRELYKPYFTKVNKWIHENTSWKTFYHTCGSIVKLLDDVVDMGVDILNPVQCSASGMDPAFLKEKYGHKLTFWGGAIDTQTTLQFGTPEDVKKEATERLRIFSKDGGFVYNTVHNIQHSTPVENIIAFFDAVSDFTC
jgi:Uroporphyrinogen-III decarboxylase